MYKVQEDALGIVTLLASYSKTCEETETEAGFEFQKLASFSQF